MLFDLAYLSASGSRMDAQNAQVAERLAKLVGPEIATGDMEEATRIMAQMAPDAALVADAGGNVLAGSAPEKLIRRGDAFPVLGPNGERIATLYAGNIVPRGLLIPLPIMLSTTLIVVGIAYWLASYFSRTTSGQVEGLAETLRQTAEGRLSRTSSPNIVFEEFRRLQVVIVRTIRKLRADIEAEGLQQFSEGHGTLLPNEVHTAIAKRLTHFVSAQEKDYSMPLGSWPVFSLQSDEFAILVDRIGGRAEVMRFVRAVLDALRQPYEIAGQSIRLPARAGIVIIPEDGQAPQEIRKRAESALYQSRRADDLDIQFYSPKLDRQTAARKRLESEVRAAVEQRRFIPVFQPKVDLRTGRIAGAEALARWKLESGRIVSPGVFIPVAESTGLIGEIGMQITEQACRAAAMWHSRGFRDVSVAVNVSPLQFEDDDLGAMLIRAMSEAGLPPRLLQLEITESVAVSDPERLKDVIGPLKTMGVRLAIDDFGTGHSNLSMLGRLPFDVFKIDRAFISSLYTDKQAPAIVEMILGMAETLGMETVAEGVETEAQESFLRQRGCDQYQGFYYSPPVSLEKFIQMLAADRAGAASQAG